MVCSTILKEKKKMAGKKWYYSFMRRHPELSLREPENTSLARAQGFNRPRVEALKSLRRGTTPHPGRTDTTWTRLA